MAVLHSTIIPPFPDHIDRDGFGHWLSGFVDGEGYFSLSIARNRDRLHPRSRFLVQLRIDDRPILEQIRSYWQCGSLYALDQKGPSRRKPHASCAFTVARIRDMAHVVVPHFERYPLRAKKRADFEIWKQGVRLIATQRRPNTRAGKIHPATYVREFEPLVHALQEGRKIGATATTAFEITAPEFYQGILFAV